MKTQTSRRKFLGRGAGSAAALLAAPVSAQSAAANDTLKVIQSLRTIHGDFSDRQISDEDVRTILNASVRAANGSALQTYSIIVTRDRAKMRNLCGYQGSCLMLYCADCNRLVDSAKHIGIDVHIDNVVEFVTSSMNTMLAAQTAVIAAKSMGIDSLLTNGIHRRDLDQIWGILELPQTLCFPMIALILGYPKQAPDHLKGRLNGPGVIHWEKFHRLTKDELDALVRQYDDKSLHLGLAEDWDKQGYKHYLEWLFKARLQARTKPNTGETQMLKRLKKSGFIEA